MIFTILRRYLSDNYFSDQLPIQVIEHNAFGAQNLREERNMNSSPKSQ